MNVVEALSNVNEGLCDLGCIVQTQIIFLCMHICMQQVNHLKNWTPSTCAAQFQSLVKVFATTTVVLQTDCPLCHRCLTFAGLFKSINYNIEKALFSENF